MGLNMFLNGRKKENPDISWEIMHWSKANQIRQWFVKNLENFNQNDNLGKYIVSKENLKNLINDISTVLHYPEKAEKLMPTSKGFCFGSQEYDAHYFNCLESSLKELKILLNETDFENEALYYTEWW